MAEPKPFASLSSTLLARKGQAKPAMRPQGFAGFGPMAGNTQDDLGWNDMGLDHQYRAQPDLASEPVEVPHVLLEREELAEELGAVVETPVPAPVVEIRPKKMVISRAAEPAPKAKAAFTLRLDPERHLRLRLACAVGNRSAQQLVTEALDQFLSSIPELDDLAERVPARNAG